MPLSHIANAHEFAGRPPPTAADEQRINNSLDLIFNKGNTEMTEQTTPVEPTLTVEQLEEMAEVSGKAASELLRQDGWAILTAMQKALLQGVNSTGLVVLPVMSNLDEVCGKVTDPEGLRKIMTTLQNDVSLFITGLNILSSRHEGKEGKPTEAEVEMMHEVSYGYSELQGHLERAINPLVLQVADILEAAGITELAIK